LTPLADCNAVICMICFVMLDTMEGVLFPGSPATLDLEREALLQLIRGNCLAHAHYLPIQKRLFLVVLVDPDVRRKTILTKWSKKGPPIHTVHTFFCGPCGLVDRVDRVDPGS
jgi:hypothetical protein